MRYQKILAVFLVVVAYQVSALAQDAKYIFYGGATVSSATGTFSGTNFQGSTLSQSFGTSSINPYVGIRYATKDFLPVAGVQGQWIRYKITDDFKTVDVQLDHYDIFYNPLELEWANFGVGVRYWDVKYSEKFTYAGFTNASLRKFIMPIIYGGTDFTFMELPFTAEAFTWIFKDRMFVNALLATNWKFSDSLSLLVGYQYDYFKRVDTELSIEATVQGPMAVLTVIF